MEEVKQIIILSNIIDSLSDDTFTINEPIELIDDNHLKTKKMIYIFDYLIITDITLVSNFKQTNILHEHGVPVTNCFYQTTYENIYYTSYSKIKEVLQNIYENE